MVCHQRCPLKNMEDTCKSLDIVTPYEGSEWTDKPQIEKYVLNFKDMSSPIRGKYLVESGPQIFLLSGLSLGPVPTSCWTCPPLSPVYHSTFCSTLLSHHPAPPTTSSCSLVYTGDMLLVNELINYCVLTNMM